MKFFVVLACIIGLSIAQNSFFGGTANNVPQFFRENAPVPRYGSWAKTNTLSNSLFSNVQAPSQKAGCAGNSFPQISYPSSKYNIQNIQQESNGGIRNAVRGQKVQETVRNFADQRDDIQSYADLEKQKTLKQYSSANKQDIWQIFRNYPSPQPEIPQILNPGCQTSGASQQLQNQFQIQSAPRPQIRNQIKSALIITHTVDPEQYQDAQQPQTSGLPMQPTLSTIFPKSQPTPTQIRLIGGLPPRPNPSNQPQQNPNSQTNVYILPTNNQPNPSIKPQPKKIQPQPIPSKPPKVSKPVVFQINTTVQTPQPSNLTSPKPTNTSKNITLSGSNKTQVSTVVPYPGDFPGKDSTVDPSFNPFVPPKYVELNLPPKNPPQFVDLPQTDDKKFVSRVEAQRIAAEERAKQNGTKNDGAQINGQVNAQVSNTSTNTSITQASSPPLPAKTSSSSGASKDTALVLDDNSPSQKALSVSDQPSKIPTTNPSIPTFPLPLPVQIDPATVNKGASKGIDSKPVDNQPSDVWQTGNT